jgi:hypothetical protein
MLHRTWECFVIEKSITIDDESLEMSSMMFYKWWWVGPNQWLDGSSGGGSRCPKTTINKDQWGVFNALHVGRNSMLSSPSILADSNHSNAFKLMFSYVITHQCFSNALKMLSIMLDLANVIWWLISPLLSSLTLGPSLFEFQVHSQLEPWLTQGN